MRSNSQLGRTIQDRVRERDSWLVDGENFLYRPTWERSIKFMALGILDILFIPPSRDKLDETFPLHPLQWETILDPDCDRIQLTWMGHSTLLAQMNNVNILTDPMFSDRCSPSQWIGPKRYRSPPADIRTISTRLKSIDVVLISHNHYDHLDYNSCKEIQEHNKDVTFVVPLGVKEQWFRYNLPNSKVIEVDWHETITVKSTSTKGSISITGVPMRHWSSRVGMDRDKTLWCGYSITAGSSKFLFSGDTAWFDDLHKIGQDYGPFDVAAIPIGAYSPREFMKYNHIDVHEAVKMKDAVRAKHAVPIHWGTFPLTTEPVMEPREKLVELMNQRPLSQRNSFQPWFIGNTKIF